MGYISKISDIHNNHIVDDSMGVWLHYTLVKFLCYNVVVDEVQKAR